ncbi:hypothetical protein AVS7_01460 [Acidovorax sp. MR-S7]|nr:hypothetical protein AVS7_01460 [Acidovorax sp. MR-S7]
MQACDLGDVHRLYQLAGTGIDGVIHCGAHSGPMVARDHPHSMVQVNVLGTANMLELARVLGARRFVYCSSTSAYGTTPAGIVPEDTLLRPTSLYGASKAASEYLVTAYADQFGLDGVSLRICWVYGPRRTTDCFIRGLIQDALVGEPSRVAFGENFNRHYVHVDDAARALVLAMDAERPTRRTYNITGGRCTTLGEVARIVKQVLPRADIALQAGPDPVDDLQHQFATQAAERDLDYQPQISLEDGIRSYAEWLSLQRRS